MKKASSRPLRIVGWAVLGLALASLDTGLNPAAADSMAVANAFQPKVLSAADLKQQVIGSTIHYASADDDVFEYYKADGTTQGVSKKGGAYTAKWKIRDDGTMCFINQDPKSSGCAFVVTQPGKISFFRYDLIVEGPFDLLPGNPNKL